MSATELHATILIAEAPEIRKLVRAMFHRRGYSDLLDVDVDDARATIAELRQPIGLVITNVPERLLPFPGDTPVLCISGAADPQWLLLR